MRKQLLLLLAATAVFLTGCAQQATGETIRPLIEKHLPEDVDLQTVDLKGKNLEVSFDRDAARLSPATEGQFIKKIHDELLRTFGNNQVTSVTYRIEHETARTINGLSCKQKAGCWTPFLSLPSGDDPFASREAQQTIEQLIAGSDLIVIANFADGAYRASEVIAGDPSYQKQTLNILKQSDVSHGYSGPGRYLLFLQEEREQRLFITGIWSGKFKLEGRPKGYGHDPVRSIVEALTDQELIDLIKEKT